MNKLIFILLLAILNSCVVPKIELTKQELDLERKLKKELNCTEIEFRHDYHAIRANKKDGMFMVTLCDGFCNRDSITLCKEAIRLKKIIKPILTHKNNYENVAFYTSIEKKKDDKWSSLICDKVIKAS